MAYIIETVRDHISREDAIASFRETNKSLPLSNDAWLVITLMLVLVLGLLAAGWCMGGLPGLGLMSSFATVPMALVGFILYAEKVAGVRPNRSLVLVRAVD